MPTSNRRVLVLAPLEHSFADLHQAVGAQRGVTATRSREKILWRARGLTLEVEVVSSVAAAKEAVGARYFNLVVADCRNLEHPAADREGQIRALDAFLDWVRSERDLERRYPLGRVAVLVGDRDWQRVDELVFRMGQQQVGACLRDRSLSAHIQEDRRAESRAAFAAALWRYLKRTLAVRKSGKRAIALAPGGISGIYHELGVLKCLNDAFDCGIHDFDIYAGISAGAVVASCLANGIHVDNQIAKIGALDRRWGYQLRLGWRHLNVTEVPKRLFLAQKEVIKYVLRALMREDDFSVASMVGTWAYLLGPIFDNRQFEEAMRNLLTRPGRTNDFRELECELLVGATDQDLREHVVFGHGGILDVPISVAVQASAAMHPFFPSVEVNGRYYTDGMVTRTSNLGATIARGADLVFVVDPFVPLVTDRVGHNARHGNMWIVEQDYKTMSYTRFERARTQLMRSNPHVSVYSFVPSNRMRRYMSGQNPFVARNFNRIVCAAYRSTARRLEQLEHKMAGELASHGIGLDLGPVRATCERIGRSRRADVRLLLDEWPPRRRTDAA